MNTQTRKRYIEMTHNELYNRLVKRGLPLNVIQEITHRVAMQKRFLKDKQGEQQRIVKPWVEMLQNLGREIKQVRTLIPYHTKQQNPELADFFDSYLTLLLKTRAVITKHKTARLHTPKQLAKNKGLLEDGSAWADWIPSHIVEQFNNTYDSIPTSKFAQKRPIFQRKQPLRGQAKKRDKLKARILTDIEGIERELAGIDPSDITQAHVRE